MKKLFAAGISFKSAAVALREKHAVAPSDRTAVAADLLAAGHVSEAVLLWTCNRVEIYGVAEEPAATLPEMLACMSGRRTGVESGAYCHEDTDAILHLFSVTSGMDSMVLGETEIAGQVKDAYEAAHAAGHTGRVLNKIFQKAFETTKEVRTTTGIGRGATSVGSVAVQHARRIFGRSLADQTILVIGAGKMAEACAKHLAKQGVKSFLVANRSLENAEALAARFQGTAIAFEQLARALITVDIVISSTGSPTTVLKHPDVAAAMALRAERPLYLIDIAVPRDIDPAVATVRNVHLSDIDALESTVRENVAHRQEDLDLCRTIIASRAAELRPYLDRVMGEMPAVVAREV